MPIAVIDTSLPPASKTLELPERNFLAATFPLIGCHSALFAIPIAFEIPIADFNLRGVPTGAKRPRSYTVRR